MIGKKSTRSSANACNLYANFRKGDHRNEKVDQYRTDCSIDALSGSLQSVIRKHLIRKIIVNAAMWPLGERDNNERPAIANLPESIDQYDTILVGYPIWWHTAPMIIGTFLESYDLTGVEVYPFTQSASMDTEQFANSIEFVRENAAGASVHDGLFARPSDTAAIDTYLSDNGLTQ